jgi:fumarate reductase subunit D
MSSLRSIRIERRRDAGYRRDTLWRAAMIHRVSGIGLALFLPLHFLALGLAIEGEARLDGFLKWTDEPIFKFAETGLVFLLAVHLLGGLRLLAIENLPWRPGQKTMATWVAGLALAVAALFLLRLL